MEEVRAQIVEKRACTSEQQAKKKTTKNAARTRQAVRKQCRKETKHKQKKTTKNAARTRQAVQKQCRKEAKHKKRRRAKFLTDAHPASLGLKPEAGTSEIESLKR